MRLFLTGTNSGLGKYLFESFEDAESLNHYDKFSFLEKRNTEDSTLIHCGFTRIIPEKKISLSDFENNLYLTNFLLKKNFKKVIYMSTIDVYPKKKEVFDECYDIENQDINGVYPYQKIISELMVRKISKNNVILRLPMLIGRTSRINTIEKISNGSPLSLSNESEINVMSYELVKTFIERSIDRNISGIFNLVASDNISIKELIRYFSSTSSYGSYHYNAPKLCNRKARDIMPEIGKSSLEIIKKYY